MLMPENLRKAAGGSHFAPSRVRSSPTDASCWGGATKRLAHLLEEIALKEPSLCLYGQASRTQASRTKNGE